MNEPLARAGIAAEANDDLEPSRSDDPGCKNPSQCARFNRLAMMALYSMRYFHLHGGTARQTAYNFRAAGLAISLHEALPLQLGDTLWRTQGDGGFGHVTLFIGDLRGKGYDEVVENSVVHDGEEPNGCKGFRQLSAVIGSVSLVTRLPAPEVEPAHWTLIFPNGNKIVCLEDAGHAWCPVAQWCHALGLAGSWDETRGIPLLEGKAVVAASGAPVYPKLIPDGDGDNHAWLPVAALAILAGLVLTPDYEHRAIAVTRPA